MSQQQKEFQGKAPRDTVRIEVHVLAVGNPAPGAQMTNSSGDWNAFFSLEIETPRTLLASQRKSPQPGLIPLRVR